MIQVNSTNDSLANDGFCTLREAIIAANKDQRSGSKQGECAAGSGADTIQLPGNLGDFVLTRTDNGKEDSPATGDLDIQTNVTILASDPGIVITGSSDFTDRIFHVLSGSLTLKGFSLQGGLVAELGGAIYNAGLLTVEQVTISGNHSSNDGGGIYNAAAGTLTITNSTLNDNTSEGRGGGLFNAGAASLNNVTITANTAGDGGGLATAGGTLEISNTILAGNQDANGSTQAPDCSGALLSAGHNLIGDLTGCSLSGNLNGNLTGVDPLLEPLSGNGGNTPTHALTAGSPALEAGSPAMPGSGGGACEASDQRGALRPRGAICDIGAYEAGAPNAAVILRAFSAAASSGSSSTTVVGRLFSAPNATFSVQFFTAPVCDPVSGTALGSPLPITTGETGNTYFNFSLQSNVPQGQYLWAVTQDAQGDLSNPSGCVRVGAGNDSWPHALLLHPQWSQDLTAAVDDVLDLPGQSRWYKFQVEPNSQLQITLTNLPANYDLTLYKDIARAFRTLNQPEDLLRLGAEFAPEAFTPDAFSPEAFTPEAFSPEAFTPEAFTPEAFTPEAFTPEAFTPEAFTPEAFTPEAFTPDAYSPEAFTPEAFTPEAFTPEAFTPEAFTPEAFSSAQTRSLIGISAFNGIVSEGLRLNTWDNDGEFYVRVRGRSGVFNPSQPFHLKVQLKPGKCGQVSDQFPPSSLTPLAGGFRTLILSDLPRMEGTPDELAQLESLLQQLAARPEVAGALIDLSQDARVQAAMDQAGTFTACPYAKNLAASTIKEVIDAYWSLNPNLEYLVLVGNDQAIPFFRHPDQALLGNEKQYVPPVRDSTTSQASLRSGYLLSQDDYGARLSVSIKDDDFPIPILATGRLVETAAEASNLLAAYLSTTDGVTGRPDSAFVSGYDFLDDVAQAVSAELQAGLGTSSGPTVDTLIAPRDLAPTDPDSWTADQLRAALFSRRHDLVFLAGHFSASGALAADYTTRMDTNDLLASQVDMINALVYSVGCHSGYNIVNAHGVPQVTREPDWTQAFARKGATLIAGTGYQYGDTDFIRYSEQLYLAFTRQLRTGQGPVAVGQALRQAKIAYLARTPYLRGIDEKSVLQATLFGLPMLSIDLPGSRLPIDAEPSVVAGLTPAAYGPGATLGLATYDLSLQPQLSPVHVPLRQVQDPSQITTATYFSGPDGIISNSNEPVLPLAQYNISAPGQVLRGIGFRSGTYSDLLDVVPFTGASATEIRGVHAPFISNYFFPAQTWRANYFAALAGGDTYLSLFPAQFFSSAATATTGTLRSYEAMDLRLFYNNHIASYHANGATSTPALAAAPAIVSVRSFVENDAIRFQLQVIGNPAAGIQEVWVTYTGRSGALYGAWQSLDLIQDANNSSLWKGTLPLNGFPAAQVRFFAQAANGVGLVSMDTNQGAYYTPGVIQGTGADTDLALVPTAGTTQTPASGKYGERVTFSARLTSGDTGLAGKAVAFVLGPQSRLAVTDADGLATASLSIFGLPGSNQVRASFAGDEAYQASFTSQPFQIERQSTQITLNPQPASGYRADVPWVTAILQDAAGRYLPEETIFFIVSGNGLTFYQAVITDYAGRAPLSDIPLPPGSYTVAAYFSGQIPLSETINLQDDRYLPASILNGSLTILNHAPQAAPDAYQTLEDTLLIVPKPGVLSNDFDPDGDPLSAVLLSQPANGSLSLAPSGAFTYTPAPDFNGIISFSYQAWDGTDPSPAVQVVIEVLPVNDGPICSAAVPSIDSLWPPNNQMIPVTILNLTDPEGDPVRYTIDAVFQDEPVGSEADASIDGQVVELRAERDGNGDGRVYHIFYTASDAYGASCQSEIVIGVVPHDQSSDLPPVDGGPLYDSSLPQ